MLQVAHCYVQILASLWLLDSPTTSKCDLFIASFMASEHIYEVAAEKTPQQQQLIEA
jgi:hypothetical protein